MVFICLNWLRLDFSLYDRCFWGPFTDNFFGFARFFDLLFSVYVRYFTLFKLGYMPKESRLYLCDKDHNLVSYRLLLSVLEYQTAVMRRDFELADKVGVS